MQIRDFHAHIYFEAATRDTAVELHARIAQSLASKLQYFGKLIDRPVGPHPVPMFELNFLPEYFTEVVTFLMEHHGEHSVLIHPETGNDLIDHTAHALWLGTPVTLDVSRF